MTESEGHEETPVDFDRVMAEVEAEAGIQRAAGHRSVSAEQELDQLFRDQAPGYGHGALSEALGELDRVLFVDPVVPIDSNRKAGSVIKHGMRSVSMWYVSWLTRQINQFAVASSRSLHLIEHRLDALDRTVGVPRRVPGRAVAFPTLHRPDAWWVDAAVTIAAAAPGPTLHADAGPDNWLVDVIAGAGADVFGVQLGSGQTVDLFTHLEQREPGALGALVLSGAVEGMTNGERSRLIELASSRLASDGVLMVHSVTPLLWNGPDAPVGVDLAPGRPWRSVTWRHLLDDEGYRVTAEDGPGGDDFLVTARRLPA